MDNVTTRGQQNEDTLTKNFYPALDIGSHINATRQARLEAAAQRRL
jgi:hypothetical protein